MPNATQPRRLLPPVALALSLVAGPAACASTPPEDATTPIALDGEAVAMHGQRYLQVRVGVHVDAAPEKVWGLLTDAGAYPAWNSTVTSIDGTIAEGETIELKAKVDPDRTFNLTVSTFEPHERMVWEDGGAAFKGVRTFTLTARDGGTDFTMSEVFTGSMMGMIEPKLPDFRPGFTRFAADLKATAEANADAS